MCLPPVAGRNDRKSPDPTVNESIKHFRSQYPSLQSGGKRPSISERGISPHFQSFKNCYVIHGTLRHTPRGLDPGIGCYRTLTAGDLPAVKSSPSENFPGVFSNFLSFIYRPGQGMIRPCISGPGKEPSNDLTEINKTVPQ